MREQFLFKSYLCICLSVFLITCSSLEDLGKREDPTTCVMHGECKKDSYVCLVEQGEKKGMCVQVPCSNDEQCSLSGMMCKEIEKGQFFCRPKECNEGSDCSQNVCLDGRCEKKRGIGGACDVPDHCEDSLICQDYQCKSPQTDGGGTGTEGTDVEETDIQEISLKGKNLVKQADEYIYKGEEIHKLTYQAGDSTTDPSFTLSGGAVDSGVLVEGVLLVIRTGEGALDACDIKRDVSQVVLKKNEEEIELILETCKVVGSDMEVGISSRDKIEKGEYTLEVSIQRDDQKVLESTFAWKVEKHLIYEASVYSGVDTGSSNDIYIQEICAVDSSEENTLKFPGPASPNQSRSFEDLQAAVSAIANIEDVTVSTEVDTVVWRLMIGKGIYKVPSTGTKH